MTPERPAPRNTRRVDATTRRPIPDDAGYRPRSAAPGTTASRATDASSTSDAYRLDDPYRGNGASRAAERPLRERPVTGRPRVANRPEPARGRPPGERRPAAGRSRVADLTAESSALVGASAGGRRPAPGPTPNGSTRTGASRTTTARIGTARTGSTRVAPGPARQAAPVRTTRQRPAVSHRGRRTRRDGTARVNTRRRTRAALVIVLTLLAVALGRLVTIQTVEGRGLLATSLAQKTRDLVLHAQRGAIEDRNGGQLAFTVSGNAIAARPANFRNDAQREQVADILVTALGPVVDKATLMADMTPRPGHGYVYLAHQLMPAQADAVMASITKVLTDRKADVKAQDKLLNAVVTEEEDIRSRSDGTLAASVVGMTDRSGKGLAGVESKFNATLKGTDGSRTLQVDSKGTAIPGTVSNLTPAVDGTDVRLTLNPDLQYTVEQQLRAQVAASQARGGCAVVKGIGDGQIYAIACYEPGKTAAEVGNPAVTTPFEPGSVNKVVTFAAALDRGLITPSTVLSVDGQIDIGGRNIHDAWGHGPIDMTATGVLAKSSNVGTLMIAEKVGPTAFAQELAKYGLGKKTGIELPGESAGSYPAESQWSATSFANLPIGQGVSMTLLQLVDMYQAIGNKGVLVSPTIVAGTTKDGVFTPSKPTSTSRVMKPTTAATLLGMLRATVQSGDLNHRGTAKAAAIPGYQIAGKTGTAQQVDPVTKAYSETLTTATFAGVAPADNPKFAIAIMLNAPVNGSEGGESAAPLFHQIASYALRAADVAPSATAAPVYDLYVNSQ